MTPGWPHEILIRIRALASERKVRLTLKAQREMAALGLGLDASDVCEVLADLESSDSAGRLMSRTTGEWMYIFKPVIDRTLVYVKVIVRNDCIVVSFHEDIGGPDEEGG